MVAQPDVLVLPETWNTGSFPKEDLPSLCDRDGEMVKDQMGALAEQHHVNIVALILPWCLTVPASALPAMTKPIFSPLWARTTITFPATICAAFLWTTSSADRHSAYISSGFSICIWYDHRQSFNLVCFFLMFLPPSMKRSNRIYNEKSNPPAGELLRKK